MLEEIVPVLRRAVGEAHIGMYMTKWNLARAYFRMNQWSEAEGLALDLLKVVPQNHPSWVDLESGYAYLLTRTGRLQHAEERCSLLIDQIMKNGIITRNSPRTIAIAEQLLVIYRQEGREDDIKKLKKMVPKMDEKNIKEGFNWMPIQRAMTGLQTED